MRIIRHITSMLIPLAVMLSVGVLVARAARDAANSREKPADFSASVPLQQPTTDAINDLLVTVWSEAHIAPAATADELLLLRRLTLSLHGSIPSLQDIREFEQDRSPDRIARWVNKLLQDRRFADYWAHRWARVFVGAEQGQFILFRRDLFTQWLTEQLHADRPVDEIVREMLSDTGLWTGVPSTNFVTQAYADDQLDHNKLAARSVRAFLGQRIDCAQCHNHPFADWKQNQFEGLAACFGAVRISPAGVGDDPARHFEVTDRTSLEKRAVPPAVPFGNEWWPESGTDRSRLASWITHPDNRRFERAMVNRTWGLIFGRPWKSPVDDLPDPKPEFDSQDLLDVLGRSFREQGCRLKPLVATIVLSRVFQLGSIHPAYDGAEGAEQVEDAWAVFPLVRLRPEQMIGAMCQAGSIKTIDQSSHLLTRTIRFFREVDFVRDYGDLGELELQERSGTIPQALLRMNGKFTREIADANPFNASGRIAGMSSSNDDAIETAYLCTLTRRPTPEELTSAHKLFDGVSRGAAVEDLMWALFNSPEFCWNH